MVEVGFYSYICDFGLTVGLRVVCSRKANCDLQVVADCFPEFRDEKRSSIRDNTIKEAIKALDIIKEDLAKVNSFYSRITRRVMALFSQLVDSNYNCVEFREFEHIREGANKID